MAVSDILSSPWSGPVGQWKKKILPVDINSNNLSDCSLC